MEKYRLPLWVPLAILFVIGLAAFVLPAITIGIVNLGKLSGINEAWAGFAGSIIGAVIAVIAALIAYAAVWQQTKSAERMAFRREVEVLAVMKAELAVPLNAINLVWRRADLALERGISQEKREFRFSTAIASLDFLPGKQKIDDLRIQSKGLSPIKERNFIRVLWWLEYSLNFPEMIKRPLAFGEELIARQERVVTNAHEFCSNFADAIEVFDQESAKIFEWRRRRKSSIPSMIEQITQMSGSWDKQEPD